MPTIQHNKPRDPGHEMKWCSDIRNPHGDVVLQGGKTYIVESCEERGFERYLVVLKRK